MGRGAPDPTALDHQRVAELLGRDPRGAFQVVVRDAQGWPVVIRNAPLLDDGTPMPTRYWLVGREAVVAVSRLEAAGGVAAAEAAVDAVALREAHHRYAAERDCELPQAYAGPRPSGGVGGTRVGVKCLHAHYAWHLAGGDDPVGRWVAEHLDARQGSQPMSAVAAIDIGTNSTNLLVLDASGHELERIVTITRLGRGVGTTGRLDPDAIERTVAQLRLYRELLDRHGVERFRAVATSASRDAANRDEFFDAASAALGRRPELLSGVEEGRLAFRGAVSDLAALAPQLVIDIGGGSTELMLGTEGVAQVATLDTTVSIDVGAVRLTEAMLHGDPPRPEELANALGLVNDMLDDAIRDLPQLLDARTLVGIAGTITTVAAVELGLATYDAGAIHGFRLRRDAAEDVFRTLATEALVDRVHNPGLPAERADVIVGGCCVLVAIMRRWHASELVVSSHNLLDGVCAELREGAARQ